jgi:hypothetical protein
MNIEEIYHEGFWILRFLDSKALWKFEKGAPIPFDRYKCM